MKKCKETYCARAQADTAQLNAQHYKLHIHENDHFNFATTDYADGTDYIKADLHFLFLNTNHSNGTNLFFALRAEIIENLFENHWSLTAQK